MLPDGQIRLATRVAAPIERVFDVARDIELVTRNEYLKLAAEGAG
jgi:hypothetical protein